MTKTLIAIVGPTAAGKTVFAIQLAQHYHTEIISADSRQLYKEMNIGVARPNEQQLKAVKHHFIACRSVRDEYNAGEFEKDAQECLQDIFKKHDVAVMAGGSGLYVHAVCEGFDDVPPGNDAIKKALEDELKEKGLKPLQDELKKADPLYFKSADLNNPRRVMRALEVFRVSGKPFSSYHQTKKKQRDFKIVKIGLSLDRDELYNRINHRVDEMMQHGLLDEVKALLPLRGAKALDTVGYRELFDHLDGKTNLPTAVSLIKQNTRNFAKRQLTWFRKDKDIKWFESSQYEEIIKTLSYLQTNFPK